MNRAQRQERAINRLGCKLYALATANDVMMPPWSYLTPSQREVWRRAVILTIKGEFDDLMKFHAPDSPPRPEDDDYHVTVGHVPTTPPRRQ